MTTDPTVIRRTGRWQPLQLRALWDCRDLILILGARDVRVRYRQTALGVTWVLLQPLLGAGIFAFVFGRVAKLETAGVPYFLFALAGMVAWGAFSGTLTRVSSSLLNNNHLISKVYFPRLALPLSSILAVALDLAVGLVLVAVAIAVSGLPATWRLLSAPLWLGLMLALALGVGLFCAALAVRYRDVQHALPVLVQLTFYATPVAYSVDAVPDGYRTVILLNPVAPLLEAFRWSAFGSGHCTSGFLTYAVVTTAALLWSGALFFRSAERAFADVI